MVRTCVAACLLAESLICMLLALLQIRMLKRLRATDLVETMRPLLFLWSGISLGVQGCKLVCALAAFRQTSRFRFLHLVLRRTELPCLAWFLVNFALLFFL